MRVKTVVMTMPRVQILLVLTIAHVITDLKAMVHTAKVREKYLEDITRLQKIYGFYVRVARTISISLSYSVMFFLLYSIDI